MTTMHVASMCNGTTANHIYSDFDATELGSGIAAVAKLVRSFRHRPVHERETQTAGSQQKHGIFQSPMTASLAQNVKVISKVSRKDHFALEFRFKPIET